VLDDLIVRWRGALAASAAGTAPTGAERAAGVAVRRVLWDPIAPRIAGVRRLFVVPDATLNEIPLAALPTDPSRYLVETGPVIHYLSAERDLADAVRPSDVPGRGLLALGNPAFSRGRAGVAAQARGADPTAGGTVRSTTTCVTFQSMRFAALPWTGRETREIAELFRTSDGNERVDALTGAEASEPALKRLGPGRRIIHLATHGFFLSDECAPSIEGTRAVGGLVSSAATRPAAARTRTRDMVENPLVFSGLALAGANRRASAGSEQDDGILTAEEVAAMDLEGVEWAVLSACDTGLGHVRAGEGVFGLRRAFQVAGVRTVVMSLWAVEDRSAGAWMRALYEARLRQQLDTAEAVRAASLAVLADRRQRHVSTNPFYWAGFVAAGDWR
jgi:CHAT domain-containing protein